MTAPPPRIPLWVDLRHVPRNKRLGYLGAAREAGAEGILLERGDEHLRKDGVAAVAVDAKGTLRRGARTVGRLVRVTDAASQRSAARGKGVVVVEAPDWRIIPLENLIAARRDRPGTLYALAASPQQARLFADTLQTGVHGIVLAPALIADIAATDRMLRERPLVLHAPHLVPADAAAPAVAPIRQAAPAAPAAAVAATAAVAPAASESIPAVHSVGGAPRVGSAVAHASPAATDRQAPLLDLVEARLTRIEDAGPADRVCIDCTAAFRDGEGLLVGSTARSFALVLAETAASDLIAPRPFRVNAGALHSYLLVPGGRTLYLSEVAAGTRVLAVAAGSSRDLTVGRAKIEQRPHTLLHWDSPHGPASVVLQTAETVRLATPAGTKSITALAVGDAILVHHEAAARHTGLPIDARLEER